MSLGLKLKDDLPNVSVLGIACAIRSMEQLIVKDELPTVNINVR